MPQSTPRAQRGRRKRAERERTGEERFGTRKRRPARGRRRGKVESYLALWGF